MKDFCLKNYDSKNKPNFKVTVLVKQFGEFLGGEKLKLLFAWLVILINSAANVATPLVAGRAIDQFVATKNWDLLWQKGLILIGLYIVVSVTIYFQTILMGTIGQNVLFKLRNRVFEKIQKLPLAFFNQNKLGDLISRINSDTDKLNQFFSQSLNQFMGNIFVILGTGVFVFFINWKLALWMMMSGFLLVVITYFLAPFLSKKNRLSLQSLGGLSAEIQESLNYFKVIVLFDRRDFFRDNFTKANKNNFDSSIRSGVANNVTGPIYDFSGNLAWGIVLVMGISMVLKGDLTVGILISFLTYSDRFYGPLRQMAQVWANTQMAFAAWIRISEILKMESDLEIIPKKNLERDFENIVRFDKVNFSYDETKKVLDKISLSLKPGKTYAMVGPTGGGKSTTASLMCRLYDPDEGKIYFEGQDIRSFSNEELSREIGFIMQEQYMFSGTVGENIVYGNPDFETYSKEKLEEILKNEGLEELIDRFENGLDTEVTPNTEKISLGQKQIISFIRAIIRKPKLLVMDEATANIDTVTEGLLQKIIDKLPKETTKMIIAHRLNTIKNADEIYFVNDGEVVTAESLEKSLEMIEKSKRKS
jgi:ATP-binding cassette subfamily B protein